MDVFWRVFPLIAGPHGDEFWSDEFQNVFGFSRKRKKLTAKNNTSKMT